jgi:hypothetical protein
MVSRCILYYSKQDRDVQSFLIRKDNERQKVKYKSAISGESRTDSFDKVWHVCIGVSVMSRCQDLNQKGRLDDSVL